jgi:repressor LexA
MGFEPKPAASAGAGAQGRAGKIAESEAFGEEGRGKFSPTIVRGDFKSGLTGAAIAAAANESIQLPLYGRIAAGTPIEALREGGETIGVPGALLSGSGEHYALEVAGDSMIDAGVLDGDTVIVRRCDTAENGTIVVALIDENEVTLKRLRRKGASIALEPANRAYETRIFGPDRVKVQGRLVGLLRRY